MLFDIDESLGSRKPLQKSLSDFFDTSRKAWHAESDREARCDLSAGRWRLGSRGFLFISLFRASVYGRTLTEIKEDPEMVKFLSENISDFIGRIFNNSALSASSAQDWAIVTPPPRRHKAHNFAVRTAAEISRLTGIRHCPDVAEAKSRQRVGAKFKLLNIPEQQNIIIFDDIITTGSTFKAMVDLLSPFRKNILCLAAIDNKL